MPTVTLAAFGVVVGVFGASFAVFAFRRNGARLKPSTALRPKLGDQPALLLIAVTNGGRLAAPVRAITLDAPGPISIPLPFHEVPLLGPDLPTTITPNETKTWFVPAESLAVAMSGLGWGHLVRAVVVRGDGVRVWESIHKYEDLYSVLGGPGAG